MGGRGLEQSEAKLWIEIIATAAMPIAIVAVIVHRIMLKRGIGVRAIQFLALAIIPPFVLVLALENSLEGAAGALIGALVGYLFSNIGKYDERKAGNKDA
jgi:hypothetical protein